MSTGNDYDSMTRFDVLSEVGRDYEGIVSDKLMSSRRCKKRPKKRRPLEMELEPWTSGP